MTLRSNRNLRAGERRYRLLASAIVELERKLAIPLEQELVVPLGMLVAFANRPRGGARPSVDMTGHRVAHLLAELECRTERVKGGELIRPITVCHIPAVVRTHLRHLLDKGGWLWSKERPGKPRAQRSFASQMEEWEMRLQQLRVRLHREPTQAEMLTEWNEHVPAVQILSPGGEMDDLETPSGPERRR